MTSRISMLLLRTCRNRTALYNLYLSTFGSKYQFISSSAEVNPKKLNVSENAEGIQVSKYLKPIINYSVDEILSIVSKSYLYPDETVTFLKALRMHVLFKGVDSSVFKHDARFKLLCTVFANNCFRLDPPFLVSGLRSLLEIGVPSNASCVITAEECIMNTVEQFTVFNLIGCLYFHHRFTETDLQKKLVSLLINEIQTRIIEISSNSEVLMLVHILNLFTENYRKEIEQKIIDVIPLLTMQELCKIIHVLAENSNRNTFILNAASFHLRQKSDAPNMKEIVNIFYSLNKLNYSDANLFSYLLHKLVPEIPSVKQPSLISGLLTACGHLRWKHPESLYACGMWISNHLDSCRTREFVAYILTIATLNYSTHESKEILKGILSHLSHEKVNSSDVWLDVVWSLAILDEVDKQMLLEVLSPEFYQPLIDASGFQTATNKLKLMNLKAVLKIRHPECVFRCNLYLEPIEVAQSTDTENCRKHLISVLSNFVPKDKYLCTYQNTDMGVFIDAEFIMDKNMKPLPLEKYGIMSKVTDITKPLPVGCKRIALLILFHKDFTLNVDSMIGSNVLAVKLLSAQGYTVVLIPFNEFIKNNTEVKKAKYLMMKIEEAVKSNSVNL